MAIAVYCRHSSSCPLPTHHQNQHQQQQQQQYQHHQHHRPAPSKRMSSFVYTILHYLRLCWNWLSSTLFRGHGASSRGHHNNGHHHGASGDTSGNSNEGTTTTTTTTTGMLYSLSNLTRTLVNNLTSSIQQQQQQIITFDNGMQVRMGRQIAEGGFSYVFEAFGPKDPAAVAANAKLLVGANNNITMQSSTVSVSSCNSASSSTTTTTTTPAAAAAAAPIKYALKRIHCADHDLIQSCRHEAGIHRSLPSDHPNLLTLLGLKFDVDRGMTSFGRSSGSSTLSMMTHQNSVANTQHNEYNVCYMLFPYMPHSLRGEITERNLLWDGFDNGSRRRQQQPQHQQQHRQQQQRRPFATKEILHLFGGILDALTTMHNANISHRDVKLENILLEPPQFSIQRKIMTPVLMDFGSAGPLASSQPLTTRSQVLTIIDVASQHTTMPYRPPELFEGGIRHVRGGGGGGGGGTNATTTAEEDAMLFFDYGKVDVWSLGCVLFGMMHGSSPFELEFVRSYNNNSNNNNNNNHNASGNIGGDGSSMEGVMRIVECTHLKILGEVPLPLWAKEKGVGAGSNNTGKVSRITNEDGKNGRYPLPLYQLVQYMINHDRLKRPSIHEVAQRFERLHLELLGESWVRYYEGGQQQRGHVSLGGSNNGGGNDTTEEIGDDAFDCLLSGRDLV